MKGIIRVEETLKVLKKINEKQLDVLYDFITEALRNLDMSDLSQEDKLSKSSSVNIFPRGASRSHHRRRERRTSKMVTSKKAVGSLLNDNMKFNPRTANPVLAIDQLYNVRLSLNMILPHAAHIFKIEKRENSSYIVLERRSGPPASVLKNYMRKDRTLDGQRLNKDIIQELQVILGRICMKGLRTRVKICGSTVRVYLENFKEEYVYDIQPRLAVSSMMWIDCPALIEIGKMPKLVEKTINLLSEEEEEMVLYLPLTSRLDPSTYEKEIKSMVYNAVTLDFFTHNDDIVEMVKLVGVSWIYLSWIKCGLLEKHIYQIAVREADSLQFKTRWEGYSHILENIREELVSTSSEPDFFVTEVHFGIKEEMIGPLLKSIDNALQFSRERLFMIAMIYRDICCEDDEDDYDDDDDDDYDYDEDV